MTTTPTSTAKPEDGPHYFHDGYYFDPEKIANQIERYGREGWELVTLIPAGTDRTGQPTGMSLLFRHPLAEVPSWET